MTKVNSSAKTVSYNLICTLLLNYSIWTSRIKFDKPENTSFNTWHDPVMHQGSCQLNIYRTFYQKTSKDDVNYAYFQSIWGIQSAKEKISILTNCIHKLKWHRKQGCLCATCFAFQFHFPLSWTKKFQVSGFCAQL